MLNGSLKPINLINTIIPIANTTVIAADPSEAVTVHLRIQKRTMNKCLTFIQGLPDTVNLKLFTQKIRKMHNCNCTVIDHPTIGKCVQVSGDIREELKLLLVKEGIVASVKDVKVHGY